MEAQGRDAQRQDGAEGVRAHADEIVQAISASELQYRRNSIHGNPFLRLRREIEALVKKRRGDDFLKDQQAKTEMARINHELKRLKAQVAALEERKARLAARSRQ